MHISFSLNLPLAGSLCPVKLLEVSGMQDQIRAPPPSTSFNPPVKIDREEGDGAEDGEGCLTSSAEADEGRPDQPLQPWTSAQRSFFCKVLICISVLLWVVVDSQGGSGQRFWSEFPRDPTFLVFSCMAELLFLQWLWVMNMLVWGYLGIDFVGILGIEALEKQGLVLVGSERGRSYGEEREIGDGEDESLKVGEEGGSVGGRRKATNEDGRNRSDIDCNEHLHGLLNDTAMLLLIFVLFQHKVSRSLDLELQSTLSVSLAISSP